MSSLRALASELGLSITTVSRALDGYPDVAEATRDRVQRAASARGYRPNPAARRLRKGASETVAVVMPTEPGRFYEPVFVELLAVIGEELATRHLDLMLMTARPGPEEEAIYRRIVRDRRADACVVLRTRLADERVAFLQAEGVPFVCHGRTEAARPYSFVDGDGEGGFRALTRRMIARGHRRIAHLAAPAAFTFAGLRERGWRLALEEEGLPASVQRCPTATEEAGEAVAAALLAAPERPTALLCATDRIAIGAIRAAQALGLAVGRDIAIAGHDDIHAAAFTNPPLTTMRLDVRTLGQRLAQRLVGLIDGSAPEPTGDIFPLQQILRASSGEEP